jgi:NADH-quinone oxidoreductase subunit J
MSFMGFVIGVCAVVSALGVVALRNPLYSAFSLVANLLAVAGLYALLDAHFLAVSQIVVYAGAIMVLVLFVLMLLNLKAESGREIGVIRTIISVVVGAGIIASALPPVIGHFKGVSAMVLSDSMRASEGTVKAIGEQIYTRYVAQFELASLVLLIGIVGAVMLAKRKKAQLEPRAGGLLGGAK